MSFHVIHQRFLLGLISIASATLLCGETEKPANNPKQDLSARLESVRAKYKVPGLAVVVLHGQTIVAEGICGVRKAGTPERLTRDDYFHLGSDTKALTATLTGQLIEEGRLSWSTTIGDVYGKSLPAMNPAWKAVTVEQLLHHRGGAPHDLDRLMPRLFMSKESGRQQRQLVIEDVLSNPPEATPGTKYIYANASYILIAGIRETITQRSWEEVIHEKLFVPLNITSAGFGAPGHAGQVDQPWGHRPDGTPVDPGMIGSDNPPAFGPAGGVHMTMADWARFVALHLRGDARNPHREVKLLSAASFIRLHTPSEGPGLQYACGWLVGQRKWARGEQPGDTGAVLTHSGSNTLWYCTVWIAPEKDFAVLVACNQGGEMADKACNEACGLLIPR